MANLLDKAIAIFKKPTVFHQTLDPNSVNESATIKNLALENAELKGQLMRYEAEKAQERESKNDEQEENEVKLVLDQRAQEIKTKSQIRFYSLKMLFNKLIPELQKSGKQLNILSWDRKSVISPFQDFGFSTDGDFVLLGQNNNILLKTKTLQDMFQSVPAIENDTLSGNIPINLDSEGGYVPNIQVMEMAEIVPDGDGHFKYSPAKKRPLYQYVQELNDRISELAQENEELEETNIKLQDKNDELERTTRVIKKGYDSKNVSLSQNEKTFISMNQVFSETTKELQMQRLFNSNLEEYKESVESALEVLREKAEREISKTGDEKAMEKYNNMINNLQNIAMSLSVHLQQQTGKNGGENNAEATTKEE